MTSPHTDSRVLDAALAFHNVGRHGVPLLVRDRFWSHVQVLDSGCWQWQGHLNRGYGTFTVGRSWHKAHRFAWQMAHGSVADALQLDHLCRNRACVNPGHLEPVTNKVNSLRSTGKGAINAAKTHCEAGHPFDAANTYVNPAGRRECRACRRRRDRVRYGLNITELNG